MATPATVTFASSKGGSGKSTAAAATARALARGAWTDPTGAAGDTAALRVLAVDLDPQANLTISFGVDLTGVEGNDIGAVLSRTTVADLMSKAPTDRDRLAASRVEIDTNLWLLPAHPTGILNAVNALTAKPMEGVPRVQELVEVIDDVDVVVFDTAGELNIVTTGALLAADTVIVPIGPSRHHLEAARLILETVASVRKLQPGVSVGGLVLQMVDQTTNATRAIGDAAADLASEAGVPLLRSRIPLDTKVREAEALRIPLDDFGHRSRAAIAYRDLAGEIVDALNLAGRHDTVTVGEGS